VNFLFNLTLSLSLSLSLIQWVLQHMRIRDISFYIVYIFQMKVKLNWKPWARWRHLHTHKTNKKMSETFTFISHYSLLTIEYKNNSMWISNLGLTIDNLNNKKSLAYSYLICKMKNITTLHFWCDCWHQFFLFILLLSVWLHHHRHQQYHQHKIIHIIQVWQVFII
jgi:hypothetical protein